MAIFTDKPGIMLYIDVFCIWTIKSIYIFFKTRSEHTILKNNIVFLLRDVKIIYIIQIPFFIKNIFHNYNESAIIVRCSLFRTYDIFIVLSETTYFWQVVTNKKISDMVGVFKINFKNCAKNTKITWKLFIFCKYNVNRDFRSDSI